MVPQINSIVVDTFHSKPQTSVLCQSKKSRGSPKSFGYIIKCGANQAHVEIIHRISASFDLLVQLNAKSGDHLSHQSCVSPKVPFVKYSLDIAPS